MGREKQRTPQTLLSMRNMGGLILFFFKRKRLESQARVTFAFLFFSTFKDGIGGMTEISNLGMAGNLEWADQSYSLPKMLLLSFRMQSGVMVQDTLSDCFFFPAWILFISSTIRKRGNDEMRRWRGEARWGEVVKWRNGQMMRRGLKWRCYTKTGLTLGRFYMCNRYLGTC